MEDLSDRELERFLKENIAGEFFCDFALEDDTPDHSYFGYLRDRIGLERLKDLFNQFWGDLKKQGIIREIFTFVYASQLKSKLTVWAERDKAIKAGEERLSNEVIKKFGKDKDARIGCKGKDNFWYGYRRVRSVDMQSVLINKANIVPGNVHDSRTVGGVCPEGGALYGDKGYCGKAPVKEARRRNCSPRFIKRNNMQEKNKDLDRYLTKIRAPYERVFSKESKKARYIGIRKNLFAEEMDAMAFNCKRLLKIRDQIPKNFVLSAR